MNDKFVFKKLFRIEYNNKEFDVFSVQYRRKTFLEINNDGKYIYPLFDDFIVLYRAYNQRNPFIVYDGERLPIHHKPKGYKLKEFVRIYIGSLSTICMAFPIAALITGYTSSSYLTLEYKDHELNIKKVPVSGTVINHTNQLDGILGSSVTVEEVINTINGNEKLNDYYKQYAINFVQFISNKYPDADLRIFNDNMKNIYVDVREDEKMSKNIAGSYNSIINEIELRESYRENGMTITHEFAHSFHHWIEDEVGFPKVRSEFAGFSLDEAMTNVVISGMYDTKTYKREMKILSYLMSFVDYSYYDYEREGIAKLIDMLKQKFPQVDIDYIIDVSDAMTNSSRYLDNNLKIESNEDFLNQLFNLTILSIDFESNNIYHPFINYMKLFDIEKSGEILSKYLEEYNDILRLNGIDDELIINDVNNFSSMILDFESFKSNFKQYLTNKTKDDIDKNDLYDTFNSYLIYGGTPYRRYTNIEEVKLFYFDMLDIYNDFLYRNGFNRSDVITREEAANKISRFNNISILGYDIDKNDVLHPVIELPVRDRVYGESKIASMDDDGRIILLDKEDMIFSYRDYPDESNYYFMTSLFANLYRDDVTYKETFWQEHFDIYNNEYKKMDFLLDGIKVGEGYLFDVMLEIGQKNNGDNTFSLYFLENGEKKYIYKEDGAIFEQSVEFVKFMGDDPYKDVDMTSLELSRYFNFDYLKQRVAGHNLTETCSIYYDFLTYNKEDDVVLVHEPCYVYIEDLEFETTLNRVMLDIGPGYADIWCDGIIDSAKSHISTDIETRETIYLETVFNHFGYLDGKTHNFSLSKNQILELYSMYVNDIYLNNARNSRSK